MQQFIRHFRFIFTCLCFNNKTDVVEHNAYHASCKSALQQVIHIIKHINPIKGMLKNKLI